MTLCAGIVALATLLLIPHVARAQATLGPGPKVSIQLVGHPIPTHPQWTKVDLVYYKELIPQRSGNRVEVKGATWAEMNIKGDEIIRMARQGQIDIGAASLTYLAGDVPLLDVADLAGLNPTVEQARKVADAVVATVNKELERFGVRIIASFPSPAQVFFCKKPVKDMADLKGRKVRTFGTSLNDLVSAIGATPVSITFAEVYGALERGVADCAITGTGSGNAAKWYEVTSHMYTLPVGWSVGAYFVNLGWWTKLDPAVRQFLEATFKEIETRHWQFGGVELTQDGIDCNTGKATLCQIGTVNKGAPMTEVKATEADRAALRRILADHVLPAWVKRCGAKCGDTYNEVVAPIAGVRYTPR